MRQCEAVFFTLSQMTNNEDDMIAGNKFCREMEKYAYRYVGRRQIEVL